MSARYTVGNALLLSTEHSCQVLAVLSFSVDSALRKRVERFRYLQFTQPASDSHEDTTCVGQRARYWNRKYLCYCLIPATTDVLSASDVSSLASMHYGLGMRLCPVQLTVPVGILHSRSAIFFLLSSSSA